MKTIVIGLLLVATTALATDIETKEHKMEKKYSEATFGAGCFWCVEAIFQEMKGVQSVYPGYSGGETENPSYEDVCKGITGHAEVARIVYDSTVVSYKDLLEVFWTTHDPTELNRQGADVGTQYRSVVFYHNEAQKELAEKYMEALDKSGAYDDPIVTEISPLINFYKAENYHNDYYKKNPNVGYCRVIIQPKLEKFKKIFADKVK